MRQMMVLGDKYFWYSVVLQWGMWSLCCVTVPLTCLSFTMRSSLSGGTATCSLRILYRKASRLTCLRCSKGSSLSCWSRAVTLVVVQSYVLVIQRATLLCIVSRESWSLHKCKSNTTLAYSIPDRTRDMKARFFSSCGLQFTLWFKKTRQLRRTITTTQFSRF